MDSGEFLSAASTGHAPSDESSPMSQTPMPLTPADTVNPSQSGLCTDGEAGAEDSEPFPVPLFVTAIGEGEISENTPAKERERLLSIMRK
eukprot:3519412-Rhodomonas_salina.1